VHDELCSGPQVIILWVGPPPMARSMCSHEGIRVYTPTLATMDLTLLYILFMFSVILFIVYFDYMLSIVRLSLYSSIRSYSAHLEVQWVGGQHCVSMVLIRCLPTDAPYIPSHVVDHGCDTPISFIIIYLMTYPYYE
jgi:hypothetical protein